MFIDKCCNVLLLNLHVKCLPQPIQHYDYNLWHFAWFFIADFSSVFHPRNVFIDILNFEQMVFTFFKIGYLSTIFTGNHSLIVSCYGKNIGISWYIDLCIIIIMSTYRAKSTLKHMSNCDITFTNVATAVPFVVENLSNPSINNSVIPH